MDAGWSIVRVLAWQARGRGVRRWNQWHELHHEVNSATLIHQAKGVSPWGYQALSPGHSEQGRRPAQAMHLATSTRVSHVNSASRRRIGRISADDLDQ